uniref:Transmembrane 4 L six family member 5 n=1 Tax=Erpetoichthys calabaricus TaxID=27687 RepID=A0A8C4X7N6_ERPCA
MCTGKCARLIGLTLIPMSFACIISNLLLLFPDGKKLPYDQITIQAWLMGGIIGGGLFVSTCLFCLLFSIIVHIASQFSGSKCVKCQFNMHLILLLFSCPFQMLNSVFSSAFGVVGGLYCLSVASIRTSMMAPNFLFSIFSDSNSYLFNKDMWKSCIEPNNIVLWNIVLFSILLILGIMEVVLCGIQVINGCFGCTFKCIASLQWGKCYACIACARNE